MRYPYTPSAMTPNMVRTLRLRTAEIIKSVLGGSADNNDICRDQQTMAGPESVEEWPSGHWRALPPAAKSFYAERGFSGM